MESDEGNDGRRQNDSVQARASLEHEYLDEPFGQKYDIRASLNGKNQSAFGHDGRRKETFKLRGPRRGRSALPGTRGGNYYNLKPEKKGTLYLSTKGKAGVRTNNLSTIEASNLDESPAILEQLDPRTSSNPQLAQATEAAMKGSDQNHGTSFTHYINTDQRESDGWKHSQVLLEPLQTPERANDGIQNSPVTYERLTKHSAKKIILSNQIFMKASHRSNLSSP